MAARPFDEVFVTPPSSTAPVEERTPWWASWEHWLTLSLVAFAQLPVVGSLQSSNWVREMPSLMGPALVGLLAAWLLGHSRLPGAVAAVLATITGAVSTVLLVMQTMVLADPLAGTGPAAYWSEFWLRLRDWIAALLDGGISTDPLPFVVMLVALVFAVAFISTWAAVRWLNPWVALVPGGFVLLTNISYLPGQPSLSFIFFVIAAVLLVSRIQYLKARERWRAGGYEPPDFMSVEVITAGAVVAFILVVAAWTVPTANHWGPVADAWGRVFAPVSDRVDRVGQLFIGIGSKKELPVHGLGATLPIQGKITLDSVPLLEVTSPRALNLRGAVYDEYTGAGWRVSSAAPLQEPPTTVEAAELGTPETRALLREPVKLGITVTAEGVPDQRLLAAGDPIASDVPAEVLIDTAGDPLALVPAARTRPSDAYTTVGAVSVASGTTLQASGTIYPARLFERYTQLPPDLPAEVAELARSLTASAQTPYEAARLIEAHLRSEYTFSLEVDAPSPRSDAVADFLFDQRTGYFDQFSTAMAVMLRTVGIPSRMAAGFVLDPSSYDSEAKAYLLSEQDSWSWPEVYFPGLGWVEFNPTPSRALVPRPGDDSAALAERDALLGLDDGFVDDFFLSDAELGLFDDFETLDTLGPAEAVEENATAQAIARILGWALVAITGAAILALVVRFAWERSFRGLTAAERRWAKVQRLASWAGIAPPDDRTPVEAARAVATYTGEAPALVVLARSFTAARYSPTPAPETDDAAKALDTEYRLVGRRLWRLVARRIVRLGRSPEPRRVLPPLAGGHPATGTAR